MEKIASTRESVPQNAARWLPQLLHQRSILFSVGGVTAIMFLVKLVGFSEKLVVAHFLGTTRSADCYYAAFAGVWAIVYLVRELIQPACLPVYVEMVESGRTVRSQRLFSFLATHLTLLLVLLAAVISVAPGLIVWIVAPGFSSEARYETAHLLRSMAAGLAILTLMGFTRTVLNAHQRFCWAAAGELAFRLVFVLGFAGAFVWAGTNRVGIWLTIGACAGLAVHLFALKGHTKFRRPALDESTMIALRQIGLLAAPLIVGVIASHMSQLIDSVLASTLSRGRLSSLSYAKKLTDAIVLMGPVALSTVMFSRFSSLASNGRLDEMRSQFVRCMRILLVLSIPVAALVVSLRYPIVEILFRRGRFDAESAELTASALACYGLGIVAFALDGLLVSTFYALKDMKTPVVVGLFGVMADIVLAWGLMRYWDHLGIAFAISATKTAKVIVLYVLLHRRLRLGGGMEMVRLVCALVCIGIAVVGSSMAVGRLLDGMGLPPGMGGNLVYVCLSGSGGLAVFGVGAWGARIPEIRRAGERVAAQAQASWRSIR